MSSTLKRSLIKGFTWEFISFIISTLIIYAYKKDVKESLEFSLILTAIKIPLYFIHERAWKKVKWGKY